MLSPTGAMCLSFSVTLQCKTVRRRPRPYQRDLCHPLQALYVPKAQYPSQGEPVDAISVGVHGILEASPFQLLTCLDRKRMVSFGRFPLPCTSRRFSATKTYPTRVPEAHLNLFRESPRRFLPTESCIPCRAKRVFAAWQRLRVLAYCPCDYPPPARGSPVVPIAQLLKFSPNPSLECTRGGR